MDKTLNTARLCLRPPQKNDYIDLFHGYINQLGHCYHHNCNALTPPQLQKRMERILKQMEDGSALLWLITLPDGNIIGEVQLQFYSHNDSAEVWYSMDERYQNQGYMTEALSAVRDYALQELNIRRLQAACTNENTASRRVLQKCGFQYEGCLRAYLRLSDGYHDMELYSILP